MTRFELTTVINAPPERVFEASLRVEVHTASMARSAERAVDGVTAGSLALGDRVTFQARHFFVRWRMTSHISAYVRPGYFVDEQERGPFKRWRHAHHFDTDENGDTVMRDIVDFAAPLGPIGRLVEDLVLRRYMIRLISARNQYLKAVSETASR